MSKKILIIASEFPPRAGGNMLRTVKLVKYLPSFDWKPYVLTVSLNSIPKFDYSLIDEIPKEATIIRAFFPNIFKPLDKRWYQKQEKRHSVTTKSPNNRFLNDLMPQLRNDLKKAIIFLIWFVRNQLLILGEQILWLPFAVFKGIQVCKKEKIDIIYSTAPSYVNHLVGLLIKKITKTPWFADYRDLWTNYPTRKLPSKLHKKIEKKLETLVLKNANAINIVSPIWRKSMLSTFPFLSPQKITAYTNGYDLEDFQSAHGQMGYQQANVLPNNGGITQSPNDSITKLPNDCFNIVYTGTVLRNYPTPLFLKALGEIFNEYPQMKTKVKVHFYGNIYEEQKQKILQTIKAFSLQENVYLHGNIPRKQALKIMQQADLLLLMYIGQGHNIEGCIPAKLFEYIGAKKPILALVPPNGAAAEIIKKAHLGLVVSPNSYPEIKAALKEICLKHNQTNITLKRWNVETLQHPMPRSPNNCLSNDVITESPNDLIFFNPDWNYLQQYNRKYIINKLVEIFNRLSYETKS